MRPRLGSEVASSPGGRLTESLAMGHAGEVSARGYAPGEAESTAFSADVAQW